jgi:hypothetical protein
MASKGMTKQTGVQLNERGRSIAATKIRAIFNAPPLETLKNVFGCQKPLVRVTFTRLI